MGQWDFGGSDGMDNGGRIQVFGGMEFGDESGDEYGDESGDESGGMEFGADFQSLVSGLEFGAAPRGRGNRGGGGGGSAQNVFKLVQQLGRQQQQQQQMIRQLAGGMKTIAQAVKKIGTGAESYKPLGGGPTVRITPNNRKRQLPVGVTSSAAIAAGASFTIPVNPQVPFELDRLVAAQSIAPFFQLEDVKIGKDSQLIASGAVPAEVFSNVSVGVGLKGDPAYPGIQISIIVTNISGAPAFFRGALIGFSLV